MQEAEKKIRLITNMYYSRKDVQRAMFEFSKNREIAPRYFEGFGKRPDSLQFQKDIFALSRKGATSFHCSEEIWKDPMSIKTGASKEDLNKQRIGWDLLIDIDCEEGMDYSARVAKAIILSLRENGVENIGLKFSGSKGFHIIVPWKAFPEEINGEKLSESFPTLPRIIMAYLRNYSRKTIQKFLPDDFFEKFEHKMNPRHKCVQCGEFVEEFRKVEFFCNSCNTSEEKTFKMGTRGKLPKCSKCKIPMRLIPKEKFFICQKCQINSLKAPQNFEEELIDIYSLMGLDMGLVSPRHLFRMPYSLHEKSSLASVVLDESDLDKFIQNPSYKEKIADPLRIKIKNFYPNSKEYEAAELVMQALDWAKESGFEREITKKSSGKYADFKQLKLHNLNESQYPPCIKKILSGIVDGKKRALFALINFFRSIGMDKDKMEEAIYSWNNKNAEKLKESYIRSQLNWAYSKKPLMPPSCKSFYSEIGLCSPDSLCAKIKNPITYTTRKNFSQNKMQNKSENNSKKK